MRVERDDRTPIVSLKNWRRWHLLNHRGGGVSKYFCSFNSLFVRFFVWMFFFFFVCSSSVSSSVCLSVVCLVVYFSWRNLLNYLLICLFVCFSSSCIRVLNGNVLSVSHAPEPDDVIWENLEFGLSRCTTDLSCAKTSKPPCRIFQDWFLSFVVLSILYCHRGISKIGRLIFVNRISIMNDNAIIIFDRASNMKDSAR